MQGLIFRGTGKANFMRYVFIAIFILWGQQNYKPVSGKNKNALMPIVTWAHWKNYQELLMANLPEIYFQVNDSNAFKSIACVADVILIAMVSV